MTVGELVAFNAYLVMLGVADDRVRLGHQPAAARHGVVEADARGAGRGTGHHRRWRRLGSTSPRSDSRRRRVPRSDVRVRRRRGAAANLRTVPAGTTTAIVGATGSGKSTLLNLLPRLNDPPPGTVFVDGIDVRDLPLGGAARRYRLRAAGAVSLQRHDCRQHRVRRVGAARPNATGSSRPPHVSRLDKDLADFPKGYDTVVGERGITLSGGQKQRTAIARAVITDPRILVLDDALSAVDTYTEEEILLRLAGVMRSRTTIIVSHRVSTVRSADQILVLEEGAIVERGTHDQLVARNGVYAELYRKQLLEEELRRGLANRPWSIHEEDVLGKAYDGRLMRRLIAYLRPYKLQVALATAAIIGHSALELAPPYLVKLVIDRYIPAA